MPGFLGGSSGSSGSSGEITFPKEFIDPVTKLRVSQPENLIDTDFEYGLQPTKWETVELINNTPSFFSKSGDTTIPGIVSIATNNGTREITVTTATDHGLAVGIPINVTGTKSVTADGSYVINSIPNTFTFTYLCKDEQNGNNSIEDLYSSIITGEFFQGSQIRISDAEGVTTDAEPISTLTVKTDSTHGFGLNTPFYFLNLNSTISQEFEASNTAAKSFDSSNSATAQTFDGSNTLSTFNIDWSNSATVGGTTSTISTVDTINDTITVTHGAENFANQPLGTPLYYNLSVPASSGYFLTNPRGVVFLKTTNALNNPAGTSVFQVSATPDGDVIDIVSSMSGTFQLANQARTFAGNNVNPLTQIPITVIKESLFNFDGGNQGYAGSIASNGLCAVEGYSGTILVSTTAGAGLDYYVGAMVRYSTTGSAATGLVNNRTYFIATFVASATPNQYRITLKEYPDSANALAPTGGTGDQTFQKIGVSTDKDIVHIKDSNFLIKDMIQYSYPVGGRFTVATNAEEKLFYFITKVYDQHNYELSEATYVPVSATGGVTSTVSIRNTPHTIHTFSTVGNTNFVVASGGVVEYLIVAGGGGGGFQVGGGGGGGGVLSGTTTLTNQTYTISVGNGGTGAFPDNTRSTNGGNSSAFGLTAIGGGGGGSHNASISAGLVGGSGGGGSGNSNSQNVVGGVGTAGQGSQGGTGLVGSWSGGGGGGKSQVGGNAKANTGGSGGKGGDGISSIISGTRQFYGGGGGGSFNNQQTPGAFSIGGAGGGGRGFADNGSQVIGGTTGENGVAGTGGGGGGVRDTYNGSTLYTRAGNGGSGIVIVKYPTAPLVEFIAPVATGGTQTTVTADGYVWRVHAFTNVGNTNFTVTNPGSFPNMEFLVVGGGGSGGGYAAGGGGAGAFTEGIFAASVQTYTITVGNGGAGGPTSGNARGNSGELSRILGSNINIQALGGGGGGNHDTNAGGSGGCGGGGGSTNGGTAPGGAAVVSSVTGAGIVTAATYGFAGGSTVGGRPNADCEGAGGGGAGGPGPDHQNVNNGPGGRGRPSSILGPIYWFCGGGGGGGYQAGVAGDSWAGEGGIGGGGGGGAHANGSAGEAGGNALNSTAQAGSTSGEAPGGSGGTNTGGGGGGSGHNQTSGTGGSGIVVIRYPIAIA